MYYRSIYMATQMTKMDSIRKRNLFKGTIAVCVLYAVVALIILVLIKYTDRGKVFLEDSSFPFAVTFAFGMLVVITILVIKIATFKADAIVNRTKYDDMMCPDSWKLQETDKDELKDLTAEQKIGREYTCVRDANSPGNTNALLDVNSTDQHVRQLAGIAQAMYGNDSQFKNAAGTVDPTKVYVMCNSLYPQYMARMDVQNNPDSQNAMRCAYADKCALPWSAICPDME